MSAYDQWDQLIRRKVRWHPVWRYRHWKVRHFVGEWLVDAMFLSEKLNNRRATR